MMPMNIWNELRYTVKWWLEDLEEFLRKKSPEPRLWYVGWDNKAYRLKESTCSPLIANVLKFFMPECSSSEIDRLLKAGAVKVRPAYDPQMDWFKVNRKFIIPADGRVYWVWVGKDYVPYTVYVPNKSTCRRFIAQLYEWKV